MRERERKPSEAILPERYLRLEVVERMRESELDARRIAQSVGVGEELPAPRLRQYELQMARVRAFDEIYTHIKGMGMGEQKVRERLTAERTRRETDAK